MMDERKTDIIRDLAFDDFRKNIQRLEKADDVSIYSQLLSALAIGVLRNIEGDQFVNDFLRASIKNPLKIEIHKVQ